MHVKSWVYIQLPGEWVRWRSRGPGPLSLPKSLAEEEEPAKEAEKEEPMKGEETQVNTESYKQDRDILQQVGKIVCIRCCWEV